MNSKSLTTHNAKPTRYLTHMQEINLKVTIEEANLILEGLGNLPFAKVYGLVSKIQEQAAQQLKRNSSAREEPSAIERIPEEVK
jgi:hypothetical protein